MRPGWEAKTRSRKPQEGKLGRTESEGKKWPLGMDEPIEECLEVELERSPRQNMRLDKEKTYFRAIVS